MTDWQFLETKLIISVSLKAGRLTKQSKNVIYSDINDTRHKNAAQQRQIRQSSELQAHHHCI